MKRAQIIVVATVLALASGTAIFAGERTLTLRIYGMT